MATSVLTNNGRAFISVKLGGTGGPAFGSLPQYASWGTGAGTSSPADTALFTETSNQTGSRVVASLASVTTAVSGDTFQATATLQADAQKTITNAGLFDAASGGFLLFKMDFGGLPLNTGDHATFVVKMQLA